MTIEPLGNAMKFELQYMYKHFLLWKHTFFNITYHFILFVQIIIWMNYHAWNYLRERERD